MIRDRWLQGYQGEARGRGESERSLMTIFYFLIYIAQINISLFLMKTKIAIYWLSHISFNSHLK